MTAPETPSVATNTPPVEPTPALPPPGVFFGVAMAAGLFFGVWTLIVHPTQTPPPEFDTDLAAWCEAHESLWKWMVFLTDLGGIAAMMLVPIMGAFWQNAIKQRYLMIAWLLIVAGGGLLNMGVKQCFNRARPSNPHRVVHETNASYPSGHAMGSAIGYGVLGYALVLPQRRRPWRAATVVFLTCLVAGIGFSRIYLRAHWFSDVIAGWSIGLAWLFLCIGWLERRRRLLGNVPPSHQP